MLSAYIPKGVDSTVGHAASAVDCWVGTPLSTRGSQLDKVCLLLSLSSLAEMDVRDK